MQSTTNGAAYSRGRDWREAMECDKATKGEM